MIALSSDIHYTQIRHLRETDQFSDVITLRFPPQHFIFSAIDQQRRGAKLSEVAYLRSVKARARGISNPQVIAVALLERDRATSEVFPDIDVHTTTGEQLYSANSHIVYTLRTLLARGWLHYDGEHWSSAVPAVEAAWRERAAAVLGLVGASDRLYLGSSLGRRISTPMDFQGFDVRRDLIPVGSLGFIREFVWLQRPRVAFNAAYFLLEHDDFFSHHSALGQAYNLSVRDGAILRPPLYRRAAVYQTSDGHWQTGYFSLADLTITLPDGTMIVPQDSRLSGLPFALNPIEDVDVATYTRAYGLATYDHPLRCTPTATGRVEYTVVDTRVVGRKIGGGSDIPQNGLVLSFAPGVLPTDTIPKNGLPRVRYSFVRDPHRGIRQAIQVGPLLLKAGQIVISPASLQEEEFWPTPFGHTDFDEVGVVPTDYPDDVDRTRAGRIGLGVDDRGHLVVVAVPGTERGTQRPHADSAGATLFELAEWLAKAGAVDAINLDGGGSTQLFYLGGTITTPGNRYGMPGVRFERMVPEIGVLW
jgi:hypothetical protein